MILKHLMAKLTDFIPRQDEAEIKPPASSLNVEQPSTSRADSPTPAEKDILVSL